MNDRSIVRQIGRQSRFLKPVFAGLIVAAVLLVLAVPGPAITSVEGAGGAWTQVSSTAGDQVHSLAVSGNVVLGGTYYDGLFRIDGGSTTQPLSSPLAVLAVDPDTGEERTLFSAGRSRWLGSMRPYGRRMAGCLPSTFGALGYTLSKRTALGGN
jgi:hypothetical protein